MVAKIVRETQDLPCKMTPAEMTAESQKLVQTEQELAKLQAAKKEEVSKHNASIKLARMCIDESVLKLSTGEEKRAVEVEKRFRYKDDEVDWVRLDTREVIQTLPMDAFDRQESLELGGDDLLFPAPKSPRPRKGVEFEGDAIPSRDDMPAGLNATVVDIGSGKKKASKKKASKKGGRK